MTQQRCQVRGAQQPCNRRRLHMLRSEQSLMSCLCVAVHAQLCTHACVCLLLTSHPKTFEVVASFACVHAFHLLQGQQ